jgi:hypothetical protein
MGVTNHVFVCTADAGIRKKEATPMRNVIRPSNRNSQRQPAMPATPCMWKMPKAKSEVTMVVMLKAVQKKLSRMGSSRLV